jgi:hypothetical protein
LMTQRKRLTVRGFMDEDGTAIAVVKIPGQGKAFLFMAGIEGRYIQAVLFGREIWSGYAGLYGTPADDVPLAYTASVTTDFVDPSGYGFAVMRITSNGLAAAAGKLTDGTKFVFGTTLTGNGRDLVMPFFCEPTKGGVYAGRLVGQTIDEVYRFEGDGKLIRRPGGRATDPFVLGYTSGATFKAEPYVAPARGVFPLNFGGDQTGHLSLNDTIVHPDVDLSVTVAGAGLARSTQLKAFSVNRTTGIFTGKVKEGTKLLTIQGAVLQTSNEGLGQYIVNKVPGEVRLTDQ